MRKNVIWTGAIVGALIAAGGWVFEFALSKGAAFIYAVVVSLVANVVFNYVREPETAPTVKSATASIQPAVKARRASAGEQKPATGMGVQAALPAPVRPNPPAIISPVPVHPLAPLPSPPGTVASGQPASAKPAGSPQQTALAVPSPVPPSAALRLAPPNPAAPPAPGLTTVADPALARLPATTPATSPGPGSGGLY